MRRDTLTARAEAAGIETRWTDVFGELQEVSQGTLQALLDALGDHLPATRWPPLLTATLGQPVELPAALPAGTRFRLTLEDGQVTEGRLKASAGGLQDAAHCLPAVHAAGYHQLEAAEQQLTLAVAPTGCFGISDAVGPGKCRPGSGDRMPWGLAAQIYSLRTVGDGGLATYSAMEELAVAAGAQGADALATSPVHAMFSASPGRYSPYGPSSRLFFNAFHIDPARVLGSDALHEVIAECAGAELLMSGLEKKNLVEWETAAGLRIQLLRSLFDRFENAPPAQHAAFESFKRLGGDVLRDHARFEALNAAWILQQIGRTQGDWRHWPQEMHDPQGTVVRAFALEHAREVDFHSFLQWQADQGRAAIHAAAKEAGMAIGVVADLAVGADPGGSQAWGLQSSMLPGVTVGAPPDLLAKQGQDWGLGALSSQGLRSQGFSAWLAMLRANMAHSGGIRIDHVLGLKRLWLVPQGKPASEGAYVHYPLDDMLRLTAIESHRHRAIVIGEDLGTVPPGFSEKLAETGVLGIRALWFQRSGEAFLAPSEWPAQAMAVTATHDLATVAGWWAGRDIDWRDRLDLLGKGVTRDQADEARAQEKSQLWLALTQAGLVGSDAIGLPAAAPGEEILAFIASSPAALALIPLEDALGVIDQPNLPGTVGEHPNWRQRLPEEAPVLLGSDEVQRRLDHIRHARPRFMPAHPAGEEANA